MFEGFTADTYRFLFEIGFQNNKEFFQANRARYEREVKIPLQKLALELLPGMLEIDPDFDQRVGCIVSRIRRDTRFSRDKSLYRDHAWLAFRRPGHRLSEGMSLYFEITPDFYGYGMGMYAPDASLMRECRGRILASPDRFLRISDDLAEQFALEGDCFKRDRFPAETPPLRPYLNRKNLGWHFESPALTRTMTSDLSEELRASFARLAPMYRLLNGLG